MEIYVELLEDDVISIPEELTVERIAPWDITPYSVIPEVSEELASAEMPADSVSQLSSVHSPTNSDTHWHRKCHPLDSYSPILTLPTEILAAIFLTGATTWGNYSLSISHVCQYWRDIAISLPALWAHIHICSIQERLGMLALYIERSKAYPLNVLMHLNKWMIKKGSCNYKSIFSWDEYGMLRDQMCLISDTAPRWRELAIYDITPDIYVELFHFLQEKHVPLLETLDVQCHQDAKLVDDTDYTGTLNFFHGGAPQLQEVTVRGLSCSLPLCPSIKSLRIGDPGGACVYKQITQASSSLTELHILGRLSHLPSYNNVKCTFPHLRSLTISPWDYPDHIINFIESIHAPALEFICVDLAELTKPFVESIIALPSIRYATLTNCDFLAIPLRYLLGTVNHHRNMGRYADSAVPWPHLETICLSSYSDNSDIDILCEVITDRITRNIPLSSVIFIPDAQEIGQERLKWMEDRIFVESRDAVDVSFVTRCDKEASALCSLAQS